MNSGSRMSYYTGLVLVDMTDDLVLPAPREATTPITGYPEGLWLNLVSWSQDGKHIAFTVRSPGQHSQSSHGTSCGTSLEGCTSSLEWHACAHAWPRKGSGQAENVHSCMAQSSAC